MATFQYEETAFPDIVLKASNREEIPIEMVQAFALLQIGHGISQMTDAVYQLVEAVRGLDLKK